MINGIECNYFVYHTMDITLQDWNEIVWNQIPLIHQINEQYYI